MFDNVLKKVKDSIFGTKPTILKNILFNEKKTVPIFNPPSAQAKAISLPHEIKTPLKKIVPSPTPTMPKIGTGISIPNKLATDIIQNKQPGIVRNKISPAKVVLGTQITPTVMPKKQAAKPMVAPRVPTPTPTPDPRASWSNFRDMVIREGNKRGYNGEIIARQKANESKWGTSNFARERYNYGGMGAYDSDPDKAFTYASPEEYLMGHGKKGEMGYFTMIENDPRYKEAHKHRANPKRYIEELKKAGYASDPDYEWNVANTRLDSPYE